MTRPHLDIVQETRWTVHDAAGRVVSQHDQQHVAVEVAGELSSNNGGKPYYVEGNRLRVVADVAAPVDPEPGPVDPPPVVEPEPTDPPTTTEGFTARQPKPDAIRLSAAATYNAIEAAVWSGQDVLFRAEATYHIAKPLEPRSGQLLGVHGTGDRPLLLGSKIISARDVSDVQIVGLRMLDPVRNPWSDGFDFNAEEGTAINFSRNCQRILIEDCRIEFFAKGVVLQDVNAGQQGDRTRDITIHRNIIRYCWNRGDRGAGIYTNRVRGLTVTDNLIDHNGWHPLINADRSGPLVARGLQAHGCYFSGRYNSGVPDKWPAPDNDPAFVVEFHGNIVSRSSANGCQFRLGGNVTDNVFVGNPMALYTWTNRSEVRRNAILDGTHVDYSQEFYQRGWGMQIIAGGEYTDNLIANVTRQAAGSWAIVYEHGGADVRDNTFYNWRPPGKDGSVWDKHDSGLARVTDNTDINGGAVKQSLTTDEIEQIAGRERGQWGEQYDGAAISEQLRGAYP